MTLQDGCSASRFPHMGLTELSDVLAGKDLILHVRFGDVDLEGAYRDARTTNSMNSTPTATVTVDPTKAPFYDYSSAFSMWVGSIGSSNSRPLFTGETISTMPEPGGTGWVLEASGMARFSEIRAPRLMSWGKSEMDIVHMLARTSGLDEDNIMIQGSWGSGLDVFEVAMPVVGASLDRPLSVDHVRFIPSGDFPDLVVSEPSTASGPNEILDSFMAAQVIAVTYVTGGGWLFDAEQEGVKRIKDAAAWLRVKSAFAGSMWPGRVPRVYRREEVRASIGPGEFVLVKGLLTRRGWLRSVREVIGATLAKVDGQAAHFQPPVGLADRLAILACSRIADETLDSMTRVNALWEALEFLGASVKTEPMFSKSERRQIRLAGTGMSVLKRERVEAMVAQINQPPLLAKLRVFMDLNGVPISAGEFALLKSMRTLRNDAVHGRSISPPSSSELALAASVVARIIVYATAQERSRADG